MNHDILLLIKNYTDTLIEKTKTKPQETLENKMKKQIEAFSFNPPINSTEEGKWLLAVTFFETTNSVFIINNGTNSYSITVLGHWVNKSAEKLLTN